MAKDWRPAEYADPRVGRTGSDGTVDYLEASTLVTCVCGGESIELDDLDREKRCSACGRRYRLDVALVTMDPVGPASQVVERELVPAG